MGSVPGQGSDIPRVEQSGQEIRQINQGLERHVTGSKAQLCLPQGQHASRECPSVRPGKQVRGPWAAPPGHRHEQHRGGSPASLSTGDISPQDHSRDVVPVRGGWRAGPCYPVQVADPAGCCWLMRCSPVPGQPDLGGVAQTPPCRNRLL